MIESGWDTLNQRIISMNHATCQSMLLRDHCLNIGGDREGGGWTIETHPSHDKCFSHLSHDKTLQPLKSWGGGGGGGFKESMVEEHGPLPGTGSGWSNLNTPFSSRPTYCKLHPKQVSPGYLPGISARK